MRLLTTTLLILASTNAGAQMPADFESVQLVILQRGASWTPDQTPATEKLQAEHLAHLAKMGAAGKMLVAGPFEDQTDPTFRGLCIYRVATLAEARALAEQDPAVKAGRLTVSAMTWWFEKGRLGFPKAAAVEAKQGAHATPLLPTGNRAAAKAALNKVIGNVTPTRECDDATRKGITQASALDASFPDPFWYLALCLKGSGQMAEACTAVDEYAARGAPQPKAKVLRQLVCR